jgi:hypothetical protein
MRRYQKTMRAKSRFPSRATKLITLVRTTDRQVEIQDIYLPDSAMFHSLKRFLESTVQPGHFYSNGNPT